MKKLIGLFAVALLLSVPALAQERQRRGQPEKQQQQQRGGERGVGQWVYSRARPRSGS